MKRLMSLIILMTFAGVGCAKKLDPEEPCNFVQNGELQRVSWKGQFPVEIYIHESVPEEYWSSIQLAMAEWEVKLKRPLFKIVGVLEGANTGGEKDGRNVIYYMPEWEEGRDREQARTTILWLGDMIYESDIRINGSGDFQYSSAAEPVSGRVDMQSLMLHELGHVLGLQHNGASGSVMATTLANATLRREANPVDVQSLRCEYN